MNLTALVVMDIFPDTKSRKWAHVASHYTYAQNEVDEIESVESHYIYHVSAFLQVFFKITPFLNLGDLSFSLAEIR